MYSVEEDGVSLGTGMDVSTGQEEAVASVFVEKPVVVGVRELLGRVIQVNPEVSTRVDEEGSSALDVGDTSVLDELVTEGMDELLEADGVAEVSAGVDDGGASMLVSPAAEDVKEIDPVSVVATSELEALFEGTGVSEGVTDSLLDVSEDTTRVLLLEINVSVTEGTSAVLNELVDTSEAVEDAVSLERVSVDGVEMAKDEDSEPVGVDEVSNELNEMVHDSTGVDAAGSVFEALVSLALEGTMLLSEKVAVKESVVDSTLDTLLAEKVSSEELDVSDTEAVSEIVPVMVAEDSPSEDVAVAELKEKVIQEIVEMPNVEEKTVSVVVTLLMVESAGGL